MVEAAAVTADVLQVVEAAAVTADRSSRSKAGRSSVTGRGRPGTGRVTLVLPPRSRRVAPVVQKQENHAVTAVLLVVILGAGFGAAAWIHSHSGASASAAPPPSSAPIPAASASASSALSAEIRACVMKAPGPDVYVRAVEPGEQSAILSDGGNWQWDYGINQCLSAVAYAVKTAVPMDGDCTTVAYASDNPGYNSGALPAPPLNDVIASAGPGC